MDFMVSINQRQKPKLAPPTMAVIMPAQINLARRPIGRLKAAITKAMPKNPHANATPINSGINMKTASPNTAHSTCTP